MSEYPTSDPRHHTQKIQPLLENLIEHLRRDVQQIEEPRAQALFETSAEVLIGLKTAFEHYEAEAEQAWRE